MLSPWTYSICPAPSLVPCLATGLLAKYNYLVHADKPVKGLQLHLKHTGKLDMIISRSQLVIW